MHKRILLASTAAAAFLAGCQASKPTTKAQSPTLETLGTTEVPASEFAYVYRKNNSSAPEYGTKASVQEYLDLYTNFKLKVLEAEQRGLDTTQAFRRELEGYKQQLAQPYLTEKSVTDKLVREAYDRLSKEVSAAHILVRVQPDAAPKDTLAAYQKIMALRQRVTSGEDFSRVARDLSEDPSARENGGKLGYFTAMQMVYPFESVAYATPAGQVSQPVRTRFGYHIIKVNDVRPAQGEIKVAHLMIRATPGMPAADSATARKKVDELYNRLARRGESWEKLVAQFSEDAGSAANGGELPPFGTGRMIPSFEEVAFKLQKPGEISQPVQTPYGWHIIKLLEKQPVPSFEAMEPTLKSKVAKDSRSELNRTAFLKRVRTENNFTENQAGKDYAFSKADSALVAGRFTYTASAAPTPTKGKKAAGDAQTLFTIGGKPYLVADFLAFAQQNQKPRPGADARFAMQQLYDQYVDQSLTEYEKANLETKYEDYRMLVKEYRDGILLFQLMDEKVWSKAIEDTVGLRQFFQQNQAKYQWEPRVQATVISAATPELLTQAQQLQKTGRYPLRSGVPGPVAFRTNSAELPATVPALDELAARISVDTGLTLRVIGRVKRGESAALARRRAERAVAYIGSKGIAAGTIRAVADTKPSAAQVAFELTTTNPAALEEALNSQNPLAVQVQQRTFQKGENKALDQFLTRGPGSYTTQQDGRYYLVQIEGQLPAGPKSLNEARGQATSDYQNYLEKEWLSQLRAKYPVKVNQAEVDKLVTK
ncbi:peptidyl-prolyl cis-trans isomerase SurA [Hymenobacter luteus]|uniref:Peptidyl-prolyl cis-trans isomerase SurA n=2 Tax=Hymenobacter TaxID=89966 RepID=A0A7W9SY95_9BACT|nr:MULTISPECIES: peptidylprolyl isomerase [Hymenobacter]MBB4600105.1 peptidyl-prolyl cis-trans isomerase SurA [Hymenobacter latericoloratus]MBB6057585.1 peptidyl-prolyl cis-trans isomerase SurA [Hymenobacter luteus]